jgi:hypothetical protein
LYLVQEFFVFVTKLVSVKERFLLPLLGCL